METKQGKKILKDLGTVGNCYIGGYGVQAYLMEGDYIFLQLEKNYRKVPRQWSCMSITNYEQIFGKDCYVFDHCYEVSDRAIRYFLDNEES